MLMLTINEKCCVLYCLYFLYFKYHIITTFYLKHPNITMKFTSYNLKYTILKLYIQNTFIVKRSTIIRYLK